MAVLLRNGEERLFVLDVHFWPARSWRILMREGGENMAYDRYDRDERSRWSDERSDRNGRENRGGDDRGFWDRASDEVASWFGDEDAERRRRQDQMREDRNWGDSGRAGYGERSAFGRGWGSDRSDDRAHGRNYDQDRSSNDRDQSSYGGGRSDRDFNYDRGLFNRGASSEREYNRGWRRDLSAPTHRDSKMEGNRDWGRNQPW
jgi:hypothetical protein